MQDGTKSLLKVRDSTTLLKVQDGTTTLLKVQDGTTSLLKVRDGTTSLLKVQDGTIRFCKDFFFLGGGGGSKNMPLTLCLTSFIISLAEMKSMTECKLMVLLPWTEKTIQTQRCLKGVGERYRRSCRQFPSWWCRIAYRAHRESQVGCFIGLVSLTSCATC